MSKSNLTVEMVDINLIQPYKNNPRKNTDATKEVVKSIKEYGFRQPIVVDENMRLNTKNR